MKSFGDVITDLALSEDSVNVRLAELFLPFALISDLEGVIASIRSRILGESPSETTQATSTNSTPEPSDTVEGEESGND